MKLTLILDSTEEYNDHFHKIRQYIINNTDAPIKMWDHWFEISNLSFFPNDLQIEYTLRSIQ